MISCIFELERKIEIIYNNQMLGPNLEVGKGWQTSHDVARECGGRGIQHPTLGPVKYFTIKPQWSSILIVGYEVIRAVVMKSNIFWEITPCGAMSVNLAYHLLSSWFLAQLIFSTLKMEAICSSETSVDTQRTTRQKMVLFKYSHWPNLK
jgi:hypothetical protein